MVKVFAARTWQWFLSKHVASHKFPALSKRDVLFGCTQSAANMAGGSKPEEAAQWGNIDTILHVDEGGNWDVMDAQGMEMVQWLKEK